MNREQISNSTYLQKILRNEVDVPRHVLLPYEEQAVAVAKKRLENEYKRIVEAKVSVSGGDDWHDGAFRVTDNEAKVVTAQLETLAPLLGAIVVEYPDAAETRATLGSRITLSQNNVSFPIDIVGFRSGYPEGLVDPETQEEVTAVSPESPLGVALIGNTVGEEVSYTNGSRKFSVRIEAIDQTALERQATLLGAAAINLSS